jgi:hypothetical protein
MDELEDAWSRLMRLPGYRVALACHRVLAVAFVLLWLTMMIGGIAGMPGRTFVVLGYVAIPLAAMGAVIAWTVAILAVRFVERQPAAAGGTGPDVAWFPLVMRRYFRQLVLPGRTRSLPR